MRRTHIRPGQVFDVLRSLHADRRLVRIVGRLTREIERLDEDNAQLHASVQIYQELVRRSSMRAPCAAEAPPKMHMAGHAG